MLRRIAMRALPASQQLASGCENRIAKNEEGGSSVWEIEEDRSRDYTYPKWDGISLFHRKM